MQLMFVYIAVLIAAEGVAVGLGQIVELYYPSLSLIAFMAFFMVMLWVAWVIAVRLTRGRATA